MATQSSTLRMAAALLLPVVAGCIHADQSLTIRGDGSATFQIAYSMAEQTIGQFNAMRRLRADLAAAAGQKLPDEWQDGFLHVFIDPTEDGIRRELLRYQKEGVTLSEAKVETRNAWRHVKLKVECRDLAALTGTDLFKEYGFSLTKTARGDYLFARGADETAGEPVQDFLDPESMRTLGPILAGFHVTLNVTTPGRILQTNATRNSLYTASWIFDYDRDPNALANFIRHRMRIVFQGRDLNLAEIRQ